jgi:signal transduction histidine kinase
MEYNMKDVKISEIIESIHRDLDLEMKSKKINFTVNIDKKLKYSHINTDTDKLKQVFLNLLTNSLKFTKIE